MSYLAIGIALVAVVYALVRFLDTTDKPKIKGLPEVPGVAIFGNLIQLGTNHAKVAQRWVKKYGPVFQTRLGNRVSFSAGIFFSRVQTNRLPGLCGVGISAITS